jgi:hypothetical protein
MAEDQTAWAHLPNARLIDAVIADAKARPDVWGAVWVAMRAAVWLDAWRTAWEALRAAARIAEWNAARGEVKTAATDAILALLAWDDCAPLLDLPSTTLRTMIDLCDAPACHQAVLLLPYALVKEGTPTDLT